VRNVDIGENVTDMIQKLPLCPHCGVPIDGMKSVIMPVHLDPKTERRLIIFYCVHCQKALHFHIDNEWS
jgi:hypothetical protein